jgi:hypothetical protein
MSRVTCEFFKIEAPGTQVSGAFVLGRFISAAKAEWGSIAHDSEVVRPVLISVADHFEGYGPVGRGFSPDTLAQ